MTAAAKGSNTKRMLLYINGRAILLYTALLLNGRHDPPVSYIAREVSPHRRSLHRRRRRHRHHHYPAARKRNALAGWLVRTRGSLLPVRTSDTNPCLALSGGCGLFLTFHRRPAGHHPASGHHIAAEAEEGFLGSTSERCFHGTPGRVRAALVFVAARSRYPS